MGNERFNSFLNSKFKHLYRTIPVTELSNRRVAIDAANFMYSRMAIISKRVIEQSHPTMEPDRGIIRRMWAEMLLDFILKWLSYQITPVFVFDGVHPSSKKDTQQKRRQVKIEARQKLHQLLHQYQNSDPLSNHSAIFTEIKKERLKSFTFDNDDYELMMNILLYTGTPVLRAQGEGEKLASMLCIQGKVAAVFSSDSDLIPLSCPIQIKGFEKEKIFQYGQRVDTLKVLLINDVQLHMELNAHQMMDLYILTGCDYNEKIPGMGGVTACRLIKEYGRLENIPRQKIANWEALNIEECRANFNITNWEQEVDGTNYNLDFPSVLHHDLFNFLQYYDLGGYYQTFVRSCPPPRMIEGRIAAVSTPTITVNKSTPLHKKTIAINLPSSART